MDNNRGGPEGISDVQVSHEEPREVLIVQTSPSSFVGDSASFFTISGNEYTLTFSLDLVGFISPGETIAWGLVLTSAQSPADFNLAI